MTYPRVDLSHPRRPDRGRGRHVGSLILSEDKKKTFSVCEAPNSETMRKTAARNPRSVNQITQVTVLDP